MIEEKIKKLSKKLEGMKKEEREEVLHKIRGYGILTGYTGTTIASFIMNPTNIVYIGALTGIIGALTPILPNKMKSLISDFDFAIEDVLMKTGRKIEEVI